MCALEMQILTLDGSFSTQLRCNVKDQVDGTPLWTASFLASNPDAVIKTHLDFLRGMLFNAVKCTGTLCISAVFQHMYAKN
jgi:S-methylmethionine-dependent homocysteine/selenocysteine methylase